MDLALQLCSYVIALPLEILTIAAMLRGGYKRFPLAFAWLLALFLTTILEMPTSLAYQWNPLDGRAADNYTWWYYRDEAVMQFLVFALVISLIYQATARLASRRTVRLGLISGAILFVGITFVIHYHPVPNLSYGVWVTAWLSNLKFCAAILDLALWALLIGAREKDQRLLMVTCALGILFAGEAIGESLRTLASRQREHYIANIGNVLLMAANSACIYVWWRAFRTSNTKSKASVQSSI